MSEHTSAMADLVAGVLSGDYFDVEHPMNTGSHICVRVGQDFRRVLQGKKIAAFEVSVAEHEELSV